MAARLTRRDMKRDEVLETATRVFHYLTEHTRGLLTVLLAVVALAVIAVGVFAYMQGRKDRANTVFAEALNVFSADVVAEGAKPDDPVSPSFASAEARDARAQALFQQVESEFGGTSVGRIAGVYLGKLALQRGDAEGARSRWQAFLDSKPNHMLATEVRLNLLAMDRADGKGEAVLGRLREMMADSSADLPPDVALEQMAVTLEELNRHEEARDIYQRIVDEYPTSAYSSKAQQKLRTL
ncbi:MAG: tetratricopeptide repeat protein [Acidobacteriota bacterium]|nr:tetratricopeptide repeat protein [Acidobacteriota bacterium]